MPSKSQKSTEDMTLVSSKVVTAMHQGKLKHFRKNFKSTWNIFSNTGTRVLIICYFAPLYIVICSITIDCREWEHWVKTTMNKVDSTMSLHTAYSLIFKCTAFHTTFYQTLIACLQFLCQNSAHLQKTPFCYCESKHKTNKQSFMYVH